MARQLRIEYPGAFYHVYSRGNQKQPIFLTDEDRYYFLKTLGEANDRLSAIVHLYCLMPNHYHLALETPWGNLSQIMHFVNSAYSIYLNLKHERCGHLFQGRFKAILVDADSYARALSIYIHGNPVRQAIVSRPEEFKWSSCPVYFGLREPPSWMRTDLIMGCFGKTVESVRRAHDHYLFSRKGAPSEDEFAKAARIGILGSDRFVEKIRSSYLRERGMADDRETPELRRLKYRPDLASIYAHVMKAIGGKNRLVRKATIYVARKNTDFKLKEIGDFFGIGPIAVAVAVHKMNDELSSNETLRRAIGEVEAELDTELPASGGKL